MADARSTVESSGSAPLLPDPLYDPALDTHVAEMREIAEVVSVNGPGDVELTPRRVAAVRRLVDEFVPTDEAITSRFRDLSIPGPRGPITLRIHIPDGDLRAVTLDLHGGGFFVGRPAMNDAANLRYAAATGSVTVSASYALGPEYPWPAAPDDCEAAARWLLANAEMELGAPLRVIGGQSSGANLAVVTMVRLRDRHDAIDGIVAANLVFGVYDLSLTPSQLHRGDTRFRDLYLPSVSLIDRKNPEISPLYADLSGLPPALFTVGTADYLYDDSVFMAARWRTAGNAADLRIYPECPHGFTGFPAELARIANRVSDEWVAARLDAVSAGGS
jgi:acetyl esterase/lipase